MAVVNQYSALPDLGATDLGATLEDQLTGDYRTDLTRVGELFLDMMNCHRKAILMTMCEAGHSPEVREVIAQPP